MPNPTADKVFERMKRFEVPGREQA
jgi:hypothetical protein